MDEQALNKKLAEEKLEKLLKWAGFRKAYPESKRVWDLWIYPNGKIDNPPDLLQSLDACFKWLVPNLIHNLYASAEAFEIYDYFGEWHARFTFDGERYYKGEEFTPALALCLAFEKLIDSEIQKENK